MRGKESRYLKPLMSKMEGLMGYELSNATLPLPTVTTATMASSAGDIPTMPGPVTISEGESDFLTPGGQQCSFADSFDMLRTLSMSGNLGMPYLDVPGLQTLGGQGEFAALRRESGRVYDEGETKALAGGWMGEEDEVELQERQAGR